MNSDTLISTLTLYCTLNENHTLSPAHSTHAENPSPKADRALKLVTKGVQNLANLVEFKKKEDFTMSLNPFILKNSDHMRKFVDDLAVRFGRVQRDCSYGFVLSLKFSLLKLLNYRSLCRLIAS